nr:unknown protein [uncultured Bacteroides sp.]
MASTISLTETTLSVITRTEFSGFWLIRFRLILTLEEVESGYKLLLVFVDLKFLFLRFIYSPDLLPVRG